MNVVESAAITEAVLARHAPAVSQLFRGAVSASGLGRITGRSRRGFDWKILRDKTTAEPWGLSFSTIRYVYMHHHGMIGQDVKVGASSYRHPGYSKRGMLVAPSQAGAVIIADALAKEQADYLVSGISF